jgi:hypothetical protein
MMATTWSDELKLIAPTRVYSIAMQPEIAVILGGHNANAAFWWDASNSSFTSNAYYMSTLPVWAQDFNSKNFAALYLKKTWSTLYPLRRYTAKPAPNALVFDQNNERYLMLNLNGAAGKKSVDQNANFQNSPFADNLLKDFVNTLIVNENLGQNEGTDVLTIYLDACRTAGSRHGLLSIELEDAVYRTDENIKQFISFLQEYLGKDKLLVVLTSDRGAAYSQAERQRNRLPHGTFESSRATILLKSYFKALYGKGEWIKAIHNRQVFLNRLHIEESGKSIYRMHDKGIEFLAQMSGVAVVTSSVALDNNDNGMQRSVNNSYHPKRSGDLIITLNEGWTENVQGAEVSATAYNYDTHVPLCFYGGRIPQKIVTTPIDMTSVAPTISLLLGIPLPAASTAPPIVEVVRQE